VTLTARSQPNDRYEWAFAAFALLVRIKAVHLLDEIVHQGAQVASCRQSQQER
jgi:hypothetical protein